MRCGPSVSPICGGDGSIRHVELNVDGQELRIAVVNGLIHAKELIADIEAGKCFYHLIEVMTCQGGCVGGAGQPYGLSNVKKKRGEGLYAADASAMFKRAEKTPSSRLYSGSTARKSVTRCCTCTTENKKPPGSHRGCGKKKHGRRPCS